MLGHDLHTQAVSNSALCVTSCLPRASSQPDWGPSRGFSRHAHRHALCRAFWSPRNISELFKSSYGQFVPQICLLSFSQTLVCPDWYYSCDVKQLPLVVFNKSPEDGAFLGGKKKKNTKTTKQFTSRGFSRELQNRSNSVNVLELGLSEEPIHSLPPPLAHPHSPMLPTLPIALRLLVYTITGELGKRAMGAQQVKCHNPLSVQRSSSFS